MQEKTSSKFLLTENPLVINVSLAKLIGLNEAIIIQQIEYWININRVKGINFHQGYYWTYNSYIEWVSNFPFWSSDTIKRTILRLEKINALKTGNFNKLKIDRTKWYRIDYDSLDIFLEIKTTNKVLAQPSVQNAPISRSKSSNQEGILTLPLPETISETSTEINNKHKPNGLHRNKKSIDQYVVFKYNKIFNKKITTTDSRKRLILKTVKERGLKTLIYSMYGMKNDPWINKIDGIDMEQKIGLKRLIDPGKRDANIDRFCKFPFKKKVKYIDHSQREYKPATPEDFAKGEAF